MSSDDFNDNDDFIGSDSESSQAVPESLVSPKSDHQKVESKPSATRQTVDSIKLSSLMSIHARHFSDYSKGRRNVTQLIPKKIWPLVHTFFYILSDNKTLTTIEDLF